MFKSMLLVGAGSFVGGMLRYLVSTFLKPHGGAFPLGTFTANVLGCLLIGFLYGIAAKNASMNKDLLLALTTGLCGGFTTFSTFSNESLSMLQSQNYGMFALYVCMSIIIGIAAVFGGYAISK